MKWKENSDASNIYTRELEVSARWRNTHNYSGIYDMVYVKEKSLLVASVDGNIQVWDVSGDSSGGGYKCKNIINASVLDVGEKDGSINTVSCFYVTESGTSLVCGSQNTKLKLFDLRPSGGKLIDTYWVNGLSDKQLSTSDFGGKDRLYVSDVRIRRNTLIAVDWYGTLHEWNVVLKERSSSSYDHPEYLVYVRSFLPNYGPFKEEWNDDVKTWWQWMQNSYSKRFSERLLDFCDEAIVVAKNNIMCIIPRVHNMAVGTALWIKTRHTILCCKSLTICEEKHPNEKKSRKVVILCGQQQGLLLKYTFCEDLFTLPSAGGFTYINPHNPNILPGTGIPLKSIRRFILHSDVRIQGKINGAVSLHIFQTFWKSPVTAVTAIFLPAPKNEADSQVNNLIVVGDRNGEIYCLDGKKLVPKFHIGFIHSFFTGFDGIREEGPPLQSQGITYEIRGRLPENTDLPVEQDCIIWSVQADASRLFTGDSNGMLVVHDFWKYDVKSENASTSNERKNFECEDDVSPEYGVRDLPLSLLSKRPKLN